MLDWSFKKTVFWFCLGLAGPMALALCLERLLWPMDQGPGALFCLFALILALGLGLAGAYAWHWHTGRLVNQLIEQCHHMALGEPPDQMETLAATQQFGRLAMAIQVMREALVDYLSIYRRFFEAAPDMFLTLAPAGGRILDANQAFCRVLSLMKSEVLGEPVERFVSLERGWPQALTQGRGLMRGQVRGVGGIIEVEASISLEHGPGGQPWVLGAMLRDVTSREALHQELLKKSTALERALEEIKSVEELKDQFLTTLSHELKTPLVALKGFLQILMQGRAREQDQQEYLDICWRNLGKLENQINNLLDLARLSHAKEQFEMGPVDLASLVRTEAENLVPLAQERKLHLDLDGLPAQPVTVWGNAEKLVQLVDNLLVNAVKYNQEGGDVRIVLERRADEAVLTVTDSGVGMAREQMAKIFNRFYQAEISGTGRLEGLGIGLSLVQEIVKLHQGDIEVQSEPGLGTSFAVHLRIQP